jgi:two-component system CheB/CheR fusion protein
MAFLGGVLQLLEPSAPRGQRMLIDFFFRSLAQDQHERAIGIVLSGTGSDGTLGVRAIKGEGGMVMVQDPATTEYDGMPRSALATGLVDFELAPAEMPGQIMAYAAQALGKAYPPSDAPPPKTENAQKKIFILLRAQTGHDFSQYKPSSVQRRIERRMAIHQIESLDGYVKFLQQTPAEVEALFRDMLIGVTGFFRDPEAFMALKKHVLPKLFSGKTEASVLRVWSVGCSTGEEAYSLAILLAEQLEMLRQSIRVQIFATDIDSQAIATARTGLYPASIAADIWPERLARYFSLESDGSLYRIRKDIRDMLVFSEQNVIKDPPFSKLDLISCRNMLIYMGPELQKKIIPLFHYALNPGGYLFLGSSETVGEFGNLFTPLDRKSKVYQRREDPQHPVSYRSLPPMSGTEVSHPRTIRAKADTQKTSLRETTEQALLQFMAPAAALVNDQGDIFYLHGRTGLYLEPAPGESGVNNIIKMARDGLRRDLATALHKAAIGQAVVRCPNLRVKTNGNFTIVNLSVRSVPTGLSVQGPGSGADQNSGPSLFLVVLEQAADLKSEAANAAVPASAEAETVIEAGDKAQTVIASLRQELQAKEEYLQTTNEELETANEELRSSNEEMQSVNEELQSTNEELETSKEELQSINEELATVNSELQTKVADLTQANNDMNNLLAGTEIATVFVDHSLHILRFTPAATRIINLIQSDTGRPVGHIVSNLVDYDTLPEDTQAVLDTLVPKEVEVQTKAGVWYTMRILPYRTLENVIEGAVITFVDISKAKKAQEALHQAHIRVSEAIMGTVHEPLLMLDTDLRIVALNHAFCSAFQVDQDQALGTVVYELGNGQWNVPALHTLLEEILPRDLVVEDYVLNLEFEEIGSRTLRLRICMLSEADQPPCILLAMQDMTQQSK